MERVLAIEADPRRRELLTALLRDHVEADLTVAGSVQEALAILSDLQPDVVVAPTLLTPADEGELMARIRQLPSAHVQTVTVPALDMLTEAPVEQQPRRRFGRRRTRQAPQYDARMVASLIADAIERARTVRDEQESALARARWLAAGSGEPIEAVVVRSPIQGQNVLQQADDRRRARRLGRGDVPWLSGIKMPWGLDLDLVNISSTGLLVESTSKLSPGVTYELQLDGPEATLVVKARFIRSEIGRVDGRGVRYYSAAAFERQLDLAGRRHAPTSEQALADLVSSVIADGGRQPEPADARFARGLRQLVRARDVLVRRSPVAPADGSESIYFHVRGEGRSRTILQVLFDPDQDLTADEFRLLKAAASLTAAVMELDRPRGTGSLVLTDSIPCVA
jgi:CheY-like chemotaxis protein